MIFSLIDHLRGPRGPDVRNVWGYEFAWTDLHKNPEQLLPLRESYDKLADEAMRRLTILRGKRDLYTALEEEHVNDKVLEEFWKEAQTIPDWVDWQQIERGQKVFYRYGAAMLTGLAYNSLLGGMGANRIVEVLNRTGGFSKQVAKRRMFETTQHILQCTKSLDSIKPGGAGHRSSVKVRLLHSAVRQRILKLHSENPDYYNLERDGIPINDLDSVVTISSFSASLIWMSLPRQGIFLRRSEIEDYIALWRLIAHYFGCPTDPLATPELSRAYMESFLVTEINPTETSQVLSQNIIYSLANQPPMHTSADYLVAISRWLNGDKMADALALPKASMRAKMLVGVQFTLLAVFYYAYRSVGYLDEKKIENSRRMLYQLLVEGKHGLGGETAFEFKWVPQMDTVTEAGKVDVTKGSQGHSASLNGAIEGRSLKVTLMLVAVLCLLLVSILKWLVWGIQRMIV
ncbi:hypothetical protein BZA77DRAFT_303415 [Pyronema omphalodes]|nr:hypothetical protein BZA77DRAFT_303415 [Pyronema omphalodes]